jgi:hypothetical protein
LVIFRPHGDGKVKAGAFTNGYWCLDCNGNGVFEDAVQDRICMFGSSAGVPVVGRWGFDAPPPAAVTLLFSGAAITRIQRPKFIRTKNFLQMPAGVYCPTDPNSVYCASTEVTVQIPTTVTASWFSLLLTSGRIPCKASARGITTWERIDKESGDWNCKDRRPGSGTVVGHVRNPGRSRGWQDRETALHPTQWWHGL